VIKLSAALAKAWGLSGWRQHEHLLNTVRKQVQQISRVSRAKGAGSAERLRAGYRELLSDAKGLLDRVCQLSAILTLRVDISALGDVRLRELQH